MLAAVLVVMTVDGEGVAAIGGDGGGVVAFGEDEPLEVGEEEEEEGGGEAEGTKVEKGVAGED